jgi:hypothetical protein
MQDKSVVWLAQISGKNDTNNPVTKIGYREIEHSKYKFAGCFNDADVNIHIYALAISVDEVKKKIINQWGKLETFKWL